jgi:hypothetical protein
MKVRLTVRREGDDRTKAKRRCAQETRADEKASESGTWDWADLLEAGQFGRKIDKSRADASESGPSAGAEWAKVGQKVRKLRTNGERGRGKNGRRSKASDTEHLNANKMAAELKRVKVSRTEQVDGLLSITGRPREQSSVCV